MHIYFIRHGETECNRKGIHQSADVPLSQRGERQAYRTGERMKEFPITKIITSDLLRARQTADKIGEKLGLGPQICDLFREVQRPSLLYGKPHMSPATLIAGSAILLHIHNKHWHYTDEENLFDLKERVVKAVEYLAALGEEHEHIAVISHAFIINLFIKYMCFTKEVRAVDYIGTLFMAKNLANCSISHILFADDDNPYTCDWILESINDRRHVDS